MYILVLLLPFLSFIISTGLGRWSGRKGSELMTILFMVSTVIIAALIFSDVFIGKSEVNIYLGDWISIDYLSIIYDLKFDGLTATMLLVVSFISTFVHIYSIEYLHYDNHLQRFLGLLSLFTFFMIWLVTSSSLILLFIGWEGIGVVSYLLVNFWYTRLAANRAAMMALLTNRIGDWGYSLGMFALIGVIGSLDFQTWFSVAWGYNSYISEIITIALVIGVIGKSSQIGLHTWLPFAMEGLFNNRALLKLHYMREYLVKIIKSTIPILKKIFSFLWYFGKILVDRQSAGNLQRSYSSLIGSSETTRANINININNEFISWFIGFTEGDGSFIVNKNNYLEFKVTQASSDAQVLFYIKKSLNFGSVTLQDKVNQTHHYRVRNKESLEKIIMLFNGNLCLSKSLKRFNHFVLSYNKIYGENIIPIQTLKVPSLTDGWLSGFTDAEGCFTASITKSSPKSRVNLRYILSQKNEMKVLESLAPLIKGKCSYIKSYNGTNLTVSTTNLTNILSYLQTFPLKTKKLLALNTFKRILILRSNPEALEQVKLLVKSLNKE
jgi:hypothetical protein